MVSDKTRWTDFGSNICAHRKFARQLKIKTHFVSFFNIGIGVIFISYLTRGSLFCIEHVIMSSILIISKIFYCFYAPEHIKVNWNQFNCSLKDSKTCLGTIIHILFLSVTTVHFIFEKFRTRDYRFQAVEKSLCNFVVFR